jgi:two-component system response regulator HydG
MPMKILLVDDDETLCEYLQGALGKLDIDCQVCHSGEEAITALEGPVEFDAVVTDVKMSGLDGIALAEKALSILPATPIILMTGSAAIESAVAAVRVGAHDYLLKPVEPRRLALSVQRARQMRLLTDEVRRLRSLVAEPVVGELLGESPPMRRMKDLIARVAPTEAAVLIRGESGTGKELVARSLHASNPQRAKGPFVAVNCAAVPASLLESELFGHTKGAFTDARTERRGLFVDANGGTLFLDEIGEMPLEMQAKLLRSLQERTVRPVGGGQEVPFNARLVTATNRDLETDVHERRFREDLYYRINVVRLDVPPLRDRAGDLLRLAHVFLQRAAEASGKGVKGFSPAAAEKIQGYEWPGNVRELENCVQGAVALARYEEIAIDDLSERVRNHQSQKVVLAAETTEELINLEELERRYVSRVLSLVAGNKTRAAEILGIDRRTLYRMLERESAANAQQHQQQSSNGASAGNPAA